MRNRCRGSSPRGRPRPSGSPRNTATASTASPRRIRDLVLATPAEETPEAMIAHLRHKIALEKAAEGLVRARDGLHDGLPPELAALEVREALDALGEITGRTTPEEVLDRIFANFCIGK